MFDHVAAIILAAGRGTRMKSVATNKVALPLAQKPIISHTIDNLKQAGIGHIIVVVGFASESVKKAVGDGVTYAPQAQQLGTGHALKSGLASIPPHIQEVVSVYGDDSAFYPPQLLRDFITHHKSNHNQVTVLTIRKNDPAGLGRIIRNQNGRFQAIVEEKVATQEQKLIKEINTGLYCFNRDFLDKNISKLKKNPVSQEYYLTDLIELAVSQKDQVEALLWDNESIWFGINNPGELKAAQAKMTAGRPTNNPT